MNVDYSCLTGQLPCVCSWTRDCPFMHVWGWVALPLTSILPRVQPEFTVSSPPLIVCVCARFPASGLPKSHLQNYDCVQKDDLCVLTVCTCDKHPASYNLRALSLRFMPRCDIMVSALFPSITPLKDVWCLTKPHCLLYCFNQLTKWKSMVCFASG